MKRLALLVLIAAVCWHGQAHGQLADNTDGNVRWDLNVFSGILTGDRYSSRVVAGERVRSKTKTGWLSGVRLSAEREYIGLEGSVGVAFSDTSVSADPAAFARSGGDATQLLTNLNLLIFPTGNSWGNGRVRPYLAAGPGIAYIDGDFGRGDSHTFLDMNFGGGIKFLLGDRGNPVLHIDYRWHRFFSGGSSNVDDMNVQELTLGLGIRF